MTELGQQKGHSVAGIAGCTHATDHSIAEQFSCGTIHTLQVLVGGHIVQNMNDSPIDGTRETGRRPQGGPPLVLLAVISLVLLLGGLVIGVALGGMMPLPYGADSAIQAYVRAEPVAAQVIAVGVFASSVPLAIYAATASARLRQLGVTAPGATIALAGGILAAGALGLSGLLAWTLSRPEVSTDNPLVRALYYLVFLTGGPAHVVTLGLLVAGMAVPSLILNLMPRPLAVAGLVIAALSELTTVVLVWPVLGFLLPIARLGALIWLVLAGALLPLRRQNRNATRAGVT
jgi:hypothetical protein